MATFASGLGTTGTATDAAKEAVEAALASFEALRPTPTLAPQLAIVFASASYPDVHAAGAVVRDRLGPEIPIVGGTSGACVFGDDSTARVGVSVVLLGGDDIEVCTRETRFASSSLVEAVPAAEAISLEADEAARRGLSHFACLVFAPGIVVDGEALVAAIRKGAGAHAQLAGCLTGDDMTMDRPRVFAGPELSADHVVVAGLFSRQPIGVAARHGWRPVGPSREVTRAEGMHLVELDRRPAVDVWLEDTRGAGGEPPTDPHELSLYLANHYELGIEDGPSNGTHARELVARAPFGLREDGAMLLSASVGEGARVRIMHATRADLLQASSEAAEAAVRHVGRPVSGALVFACTGRLAALGPRFPEEHATIRQRVAGPIGGACVYGEIARNVRDVDAFFNTTVVVVAFAR